MKNRSIVPVVVAFVLSLGLAAAAQEKDVKKEGVVVIELKSGAHLVGRILEMNDKIVKIELESGGTIDQPLDGIVPFSLYQIREGRIDPQSAKAHAELGDFALKNELYPYAVREYTKALNLDASLEPELKKKIEEAKQGDAKKLFEEGIARIKEEKYEEAEKKLSLVIVKYPGSDYDAQAQVELKKIAALIKERNDKRQKTLEDEKKKLEEKLKDKKALQLKASFDAAVGAVDEAKKMLSEGLAAEARGSVSDAARNWTNSENYLIKAKEHLDKLAASTKDVDVIDGCKEKKKEIDQTLMNVYYHIGNLWLTQFNTPEAKRWINKGLMVDPSNQDLLKLKTLLTELMVRERVNQPTR